MDVYKLVLELTLLIMTTYHYYNSCNVLKHITLRLGIRRELPYTALPVGVIPL